jgi:hypothetical protein
MMMEPPSSYLELRRQIDELVETLATLRRQENEIIRQMLSGVEQLEVPLQFDDKTQTVRWSGNALKLGGKSYLFVKTLWQAPRHRQKMETLEQSVWKLKEQRRYMSVKTKKGIRNVQVASRFLSQNTLKLFLFRLQNRLRTAQFPYKIVPVKSRKNGTTGEIVGYGLKCVKRYIKYQEKYRSSSQKDV